MTARPTRLITSRDILDIKVPSDPNYAPDGKRVAYSSVVACDSWISFNVRPVLASFQYSRPFELWAGTTHEAYDGELNV